MALLSFLDREHTVAKPGFSRWMVPPAALCVHLCIGQAYALSVFNLPMTKLLGITQSAPGDWKLTELGWIFSIAMVFLGGSAAVFGRWVEDGGPRRAMFTAGALLGRRILPFGDRRLHPHALAHLHRLRRARRLRPRHRLHLAGLDADQMVSRPARNGNRHGHHGFRRRRVHRLAAVGVVARQVHHRHPCRRCRNFHRDGVHLLLLHDRRLDHRARPGTGLEAGRLCCAGDSRES